MKNTHFMHGLFLISAISMAACDVEVTLCEMDGKCCDENGNYTGCKEVESGGDNASNNAPTQEGTGAQNSPNGGGNQDESGKTEPSTGGENNGDSDNTDESAGGSSDKPGEGSGHGNGCDGGQNSSGDGCHEQKCEGENCPNPKP